MLSIAHDLNDSIGKELLDALINEMAQQQKPWQQLSEFDQKESIYRLSSRIKDQVRGALIKIATDERITIVATLKKIDRGEEIKAQFIVQSSDPKRHDLFDSVNHECLIVVVDTAQYLTGIDNVHPEPDQRALDLGQEYKDVED